jgi:hypothetical protein
MTHSLTVASHVVADAAFVLERNTTDPPWFGPWPDADD